MPQVSPLKQLGTVGLIHGSLQHSLKPLYCSEGIQPFVNN